MKKLLLLCFILFALVSFVKADTVIVVGQAVCTKGSAVMDGTSASHVVALSTDADGQGISDAAQWRLHSIKIQFHSNGDSNCEVEVRIGPNKDLTDVGDTYMEKWTYDAFSGDTEWIELISVNNDTYSAATTYYIGVMETTATCVALRDNTNPYDPGGKRTQTDAGSTLGADDAGNDLIMEVYRCN